MLLPSIGRPNLAIVARLALPSVLLVILASPGLAPGAVHTVSYSNVIDPPVVVADGDPGDFDFDPDEIEVHFMLEDPIGDDWVATGVILATTTDPAGATLVVTNTTIQNVTGNYVLGAQIIVSHDFPPLVSFTQQYVAHVDGSFDKVGGGLLGSLTLNYSASITGNSLGGQGFAANLVPAPKFFDWTGLPKHEDTVINQTEHFIFYIDELDNTINLFDSATILPFASVGTEQRPWGAIKGLYR
jgi:hypothetical protein